ncbi:matrin 3-like 1.2 [Aplochiton taeniatus]
MSQKNNSDSGEKGFAVGRGLLAAAETLNFSMSEQRSGHMTRQMGGMGSGMGGGLGGGEGLDHNAQLPRRGGNHIGNTMKLFASLGLSPADLDALAQIPEENISVETLPDILMQLKNRKGDPERRMAGNPRDLPTMSPETPYRASRDEWEDMGAGRMGGSPMGQALARAPTADFGYSSLQDAPARGYDSNYGGKGGGGGGRERPYSVLSHEDHYDRLGMGPPPSDSVFMQRRMGSPSQGKVQDFLGIMPPMFPHVCSLCDFDVHSTMEWNQHTNGLRHAENRRKLLQMYPDWDPGMAPNRSSGSYMSETTNCAAGLLGAAPLADRQPSSSMPSSWGGGAGTSHSGKGQPHSVQPKIRSRVVVARYDRKPQSNKVLFGLPQPFGHYRSTAFLEMETHQQALDMVTYYLQQPALMHGKKVHFYLSKELMMIEKDGHRERGPRDVKGRASQVVYFSCLPREDEKKMELLTIARRFGTVEKHLFLVEEAFVQLGTPEDAEMLVKYYTLNPLTIRGKAIRLNICAKYKTLNVNRNKGSLGGALADGRGRKGSSGTSSGTKAAFSKVSTKSTSSTSTKESESGNTNPESMDTPEEEQEANLGPEEATSNSIGITKNTGQQQEKGTEEQAEAEISEPGDAEASTEESQAKDETRTTEPEEDPGLAEGDIPEDQEGSMDQDFMENMEDFVTLDELGEDEDPLESTEDSSIDNSRKGGLRVVNILGFKRGYGFLNELLSLAKPFGTVVKHLVLDLRPEAFLQLATEEQAKAMARFYHGNVTPMVCGRAVRINHSQTYPTIKGGGSRVVYIGQLPNTKFSDDSLLKLAESFGKVKKYFLNRIKRECFIEMENAEDADKMAETCKQSPPKFQGKRLTVYVSRKYKQLKYGHRCPNQPEDKKPSKRDWAEEDTSPSSIGMPTKASAKQVGEPPLKKVKEEQSPATVSEEGDKEKDEEAEMSRGEQQSTTEPVAAETDKVDAASKDQTSESLDLTMKQEEMEAEISTNVGPSEENGHPSASQALAETKPASLPLAPYEPNIPTVFFVLAGVEYVKMGYYCRVCFLFYSNEETAKKVHCSSQAHYNKLEKYLEKEKAKAQGSTVKKMSR